MTYTVPAKLPLVPSVTMAGWSCPLPKEMGGSLHVFPPSADRKATRPLSPSAVKKAVPSPLMLTQGSPHPWTPNLCVDQVFPPSKETKAAQSCVAVHGEGVEATMAVPRRWFGFLG